MELFVFSQDEQLLTIISEDTGLVEAPYRIEVNSIPTEPFSLPLNLTKGLLSMSKKKTKQCLKTMKATGV